LSELHDRKGNTNRNKRTILLVDDEQDIITGFKIGLEETGLFRVDAFTDPQLALSNLSKVGLNYYDLLLIDIKIPQMNGFELYQKIKSSFAEDKEGKAENRNSIRSTKVCFITAYEIYYETLKKEFPTLNVGCFIKKPIEIKELVNRIKQELEINQ
jgi:two-component system, OmpR family, response regulator ChvI